MRQYSQLYPSDSLASCENTVLSDVCTAVDGWQCASDAWRHIMKSQGHTPSWWVATTLHESVVGSPRRGVVWPGHEIPPQWRHRTCTWHCNTAVRPVHSTSSRRSWNNDNVVPHVKCSRISPPRFLAECRKRRLNRASFVLLCFALFAFSGLCLICVVYVFNLSAVLYLPACTNVNGTV